MNQNNFLLPFLDVRAFIKTVLIMAEIIFLGLYSAGLKLKKMVIKMKVQSDVDLTDSTTSSLFLQKVQT